MFLQYYGLREQPFGMTPDPRFLYMSGSHREALASLIYGIETGRGFVSLIAEPGMGKTTLLFQLMEQFRDSARTAFLFQTQGDTREFLSNLIADVGLVPDDRDVSSLQRQLNEILVQEARLGRRFVLVIDEAQNLDDSVLESVRMLSNFETSRSKLMQIVLSGQPPLADKLARPELEQLMQRVSIVCRLKPFTPKEVAEFIEYRLKTAGYTGHRLFTPEALSLIANVSEGIPRNINNICFNALSLGYADRQKKIDRGIVEEVLNDLELDSPASASVSPTTDVRSPQRERPKAFSGLEDVTLNARRSEEADRPPSRRRRYSAPDNHGIAGGRRRRSRESHWPVWAVILLTIVLAGEMVQTFIPAGERRQAVTHLVAETVSTAKSVAGTYLPLKKDSSPEASKPQTTIVKPDPNDVPKPVRPSTSESSVPANTEAGKSDSPEASAPDTTSEVTGGPGPAAVTPVAIPVKPASRTVESSPVGDSAPSEQTPKGKIIVESNVPGSTIIVNGRRDPEWRTPHVFNLPEGTYRISISQKGYATWYRVVQVKPGRKRWISADLHLPRGVVVIETDPPGMQVFIDGKAYGPSDVQATLDSGLHKFKVVPPGGKRPVEGSFVLKPGDILTRKIRWLSRGAQPSAANQPGATKPQSIENPVKEKEKS